MYDINLFRQQCEFLLQNAINNGKTKEIEKFQVIKEFLKNDDCFVGARQIFVVFVLENLGYNNSECDKIYNYFNNICLYEGVLEYVSDDGQLIRISTFVNPDLENYYKFVNGPVFKYSTIDSNFYSLLDGQWVYDGSLQKKFYDAGYDYVSIKCFVNKNSPRR